MAVATGDSKDSAPAKKTRGLSFEEKRKRLSEFLLEKVSIRNLKVSNDIL